MIKPKDLSIIIPARNEMFLKQTIDNILENAEADTEVIAVCDGNWPDPPLEDHPKVEIIYHSEAIGQRQSTNEGARLSRAKYIMKADAHCAFGKGFDKKLIEPYEAGRLDRTVTSVPRMYNLHAFDWECQTCKKRVYQGPKPTKCKECDGGKFEMAIVWKPRLSRRSDGLRFDSDMKFQYWREYESRPECVDVDLLPVLGCLGACFFLNRERYWELGGSDESHGGWGQYGTEVAVKAWLSGGQLICNRNTWFSHMFRTNNAGFSFPYPISGHEVHIAKEYSKDLWLNDKWDKAKYPLSWLLEKFWPVPGWTDEDLAKLKK